MRRRRKSIGEGGHGGEVVGGNGGADSYLERSSHLSLRPYKRKHSELKTIQITDTFLGDCDTRALCFIRNSLPLCLYWISDYPRGLQ